MNINILFFFLISKILITKQECIANSNQCTKCNPVTKLCVKCDKDIYLPDEKGGCGNAKKCFLGKNHCFECSDDEKLCKECDIGYFPDENGACSITENCEVSYKGECLKCKENYILIGRKGYHAEINDYIKLCKPLNTDDLKNCESVNSETGKCYACKDGYYLNSYDKKCSKILNCAESLNGNCVRCNYSYYLNKKKQECNLQSGVFLDCKISNDGKQCDECINDFYFDEEGKCVYSNYCSDGNREKCNKCIKGYYLALYGGACTTEENCFSGRRDIGICTQCTEKYYIDFKDGKCKSNEEDNDFKYCRIADGKCKECNYGAYLGLDQKCSTTYNCAKSEKGKCIQCADNFYLGLDNKCTSVEHCIYSDSYFNCIQCADKYYYNRINKTCLLAEGNFKNCRIANNTVCENCNTNFYINQKNHLCYSNQEKNDYYKCEIMNGDYCIQCINEYFLGAIDHKCSTVQNCDVIENENRCLVCSIYYCVDGKTGQCEDNDIINDMEKKFYFRCNRTNSESTGCETCLEGYELKDGLCYDDQHCIEKKDGKCTKCQKTEYEYYEQCINNVFGCIEAYYDEYCLECNNLTDIGTCTKCIEGFELDEYDVCFEPYDEDDE